MFTIRFATRTHRPDEKITLRNNVDGWDHDWPALYERDEWVVTLDEDRYPQGLEFKFMLDEERWMMGDNLRIVPQAGNQYFFDEGVVQFPDQTPGVPIVVENGIVARRFFPPTLDDELFDVVVVGSGAGGGVVADQLSDLGKRVLVLEAGSYLFPTHVANLPRQHELGRFDKHVWRLWHHFKVDNYVNSRGSAFRGGQGFNLGGRSIFWGGLAPQMDTWELDSWPPAVAEYLQREGYRRAEEIMNVRAQIASPYQKATKLLLAGALPQYAHMDAPMAVQSSGFTGAAIPTGMFSTADLLMESRLTEGITGSRNLVVNLNHHVVEVQHDGQRALAVVASDLVAEQKRVFRGRSIVLAAGTIETAKLALASGINDPNSAIGRGFTDHPIFFTHFAIPRGSPHASTRDSSKTLSRHREATAHQHPYTMVLELGADFNQGRYLDDELLEEFRRARGDVMFAEVVFLFHAPLVESNRVQLGGSMKDRALVSMAPSTSADPFRAEVERVKDQVIGLLGGEPIDGANLALNLGVLGGVAHEVGTMRMSADASGVVDATLRVLGYSNLYVCDNSVLPTSPAANPTLTLVALADRLARTLAAQE